MLIALDQLLHERAALAALLSMTSGVVRVVAVKLIVRVKHRTAA